MHHVTLHPFIHAKPQVPCITAHAYYHQTCSIRLLLPQLTAEPSLHTAVYELELETTLETLQAASFGLTLDESPPPNQCCSCTMQFCLFSFMLGLPYSHRFQSIPIDSCQIPIDSCQIPIDSLQIPIDSHRFPSDSNRFPSDSH